MGRLWDGHFGDLGYLPKKYGVQDARFTINSSNGLDFSHFLQKIVGKSKKNNIPVFLRKQIDVSLKKTKTKMTAMQKSIDLKHPRTIFIEQSIKIKGLGKNGGSIMHPYF